MKKVILFWMALVAIISPLAGFAQIIEENPIYYEGYPGEPILRSVTKDNYYQFRHRDGYNSRIVTLNELAKLAEKFPGLKKYNIIVRIDYQITGKGNIIVNSEEASYYESHWSGGEWRTGGWQLGTWNTERERGTGIFEPGVNSASFDHPSYIIAITR